MTTGDNHFIISSNRLVESVDLSDRFQTPLRANMDNIAEKVYPDPGVFGDTRLQLAALTDAFSIVGPGIEATDGDGKIIDLSQATDDGSSVSFENTAATDYYVGLEYVERPIGIKINPKNGQPEYEQLLEDVGVKGDPDSVTDGGAILEFNINSLLESGVDHSGRQVAVYRKVPAAGATTEAVAIEVLTVAYAAPNNTVTTTGLLGQSSPASTTVTDYECVVLGPTVRRDTDLRDTDGVAFIGIVTGGGAGNPASAVDISDQNLIDISLSGFNTAIDAFITGVDVSLASGTKEVTGRRDDMITAVERAAGTYYSGNGFIYVMGGLDSGASEVNDNQSYDPVLDAWTARTAVPLQSNGGAAADGRADARLVELSGTLYLIGGWDQSSAAARVELVQRYDPDTDTWLTPADDLPAIRSGGYVGVINGKIYYAGGTADGTAGLDNTYEYDPVGDSWSEVASIASSGTPATSERGAFAVANNKLYIIGGQTGGSFGQAKTYVYDPAVDTWTLLTDIPKYDQSTSTGTHRLSAAATVNGVIHVFGGLWLGLHDRAPAHLMYNTVLDEWYFPDPPRWGGAANHLAIADPTTGLIFLIGGSHNEDDSTAGAVVDGRVAAYDASQIFLADSPGMASITGKRGADLSVDDAGDFIDENPFFLSEQMPAMPTGPRYACRAAVLDGKIYVFGGIDDAGSYAVAGITLEMFCPETNTWTALADFTSGAPSFPNAYGGFVADESNNLLFVMFGESAAGTERDEIYKYEVYQNDWVSENTTLSIFRSRGACVLVDNTLWWIGGIDGGGTEVTDTFMFDRSLQVATAGPALNSPRRNMGAVVIPNTLLAQGDFGGEESGETTGHTIYVNAGHDGAAATGEVEILDTRDLAWIEAAPWFGTHQGHATVYLRNKNTGVITLYAVAGAAAGPGPLIDSEAIRLNGVFIGSAGGPDHVTPRIEPAAAVVDNVIYVFGGADDLTPTTAYDTVEAFGFYEADAPLLENFSAQNQDSFTNVRARKVDKRDTIGFRAGQIWGIGSWHPNESIDYVRIGEIT